MDRFSCLPDEVICHILSFLPTQRSVQTCVLSKRWRFLWANVPCLEFDFRGTANIITQFLLQLNHDIHTFHLFLDTYRPDSARHFNGIEEFKSWIVSITTRNVCDFIIISAGDHFWLTKISCLNACKTSNELCLSGCAGIPVSGICFPALGKLKLECVISESYEFRSRESLARIAHVLSGCPVLEALSIEGRMLGQFCVSSLVLTRLVLQLDDDLYLDDDVFLNFGVKLDTPVLRYLQLDSFMSDKFLIESLDSLVEADICLYWSKKHQDHLVYSRNVLAFVDMLCNVKVLKLSTDRIAEIRDSAYFGLANRFHNLTDLDLSVHSNLGFVTSFLENANNLRVLSLIIRFDIDQCYWIEPKQVPSCLTSHLQTVDICDFGYSVPEFDMIRYILMNGRVLRRMEIRTRRDKHDRKKFKAIGRLALFDRGSQECQLVLD